MNGKRMRLRTNGQYKENLRSFYLVKYKDEEYKVRMWNFQIGRKGTPEFIDCIVTESHSCVKIVQDQTTLIKEIYKVGETYSFRIKNRLKNRYTVVDINGMMFRLPYTDKDPKLTDGQSVMARVKSVDGMNVKLELSHDIDATKLSFRTIEELASDAHLPEGAHEMISAMMESRPELSNTKLLYESKDTQWAFEATLALDQVILHADSETNSPLLLEVLKRLSTYLLEESDLLRKMSEANRKFWINRLTTVAEHTEMYDETARIISNGQQRDYIDRQLKNLKESENLYQPERKLRIIMTIFNRYEDLMAEMTDRIFDVILDGNKQHWVAEPFRSAFVDMLEIFIAAHRSQAGLSPSSSIAQKMIKAIAIQLLLSNNEDNIDRRLNRTTFYRLLATQQNYDSKNILDDAYNCLFADYDEEIEYDWDDISSIDNLYIKVIVSHRKELSAQSFWRQVYRTDRNELIVDDSGIVIQPVLGRHQSLLPNELLQWHNLDVRGTLGIKTKFKSSKNLNTAVKVWQEIEENLAHKPVAGLYAKATPDVDDVVIVKIVDTSEDMLSFYCEIEDEHYKGHGWINLDEIVQYMGKNERNLSYFFDDEGNPLLFEATVIAEPDSNDDLEFSMLGLIDDYFRQIHYVGDTLLCNVRDIDKYDKQSYVCFSSDGASCIVRNDGTLRLQKDDIIEVRLLEFTQTGQHVCEFVDHSLERFNIIDAFKTMLAGITLDAPQQQALPEEQMNDDVVTEMIGILDRLAVCASTRIETYGYLSLAKILGEMISDDNTAGYYDRRRTLVKLFNDYETAGRIDMNKIHEIEEQMDEQAARSDFYINEALTKFRILAALRHKASADELMEISRTAVSPNIRDAADMAVALLLTSRFDIPTIKTQLEDRINKCLGVNIRTTTLKEYGPETQEIELKSSIVYPADSHMLPQPKHQEEIILHVVCGFLNSDTGGTLYIGVNKNGGACGVQNDLRYFGNVDEDFYDRHIHNLINRKLGTIANQCCNDSSWETDEGYRIYVMKIKPAPELIRYDKVCWIRQGTETRPLREDSVETFAEMHAIAYRKFINADQTDASIEPIAEEKSKNADTKKAPELYNIATSHWRRNVVFDYEDGYGANTAAYLHFLKDDKYMVSDEGTYEETHLSLAIHEKDTDGYLLVGYESGRLLIVETSELLNKTRLQRYQRCKSEKPIFACPMRRDDLVLTLWENKRGETLARVDTIDDMIARHIDGDMNSEGALLCDTKFNRFIQCEIVKPTLRPKMQKFRNQGDGLGQKITQRSASDIALLKELFGEIPS